MSKYNWEEIEKELDTLTNRQIAEKYGISSQRVVANYRNRKHTPKKTKTHQYADVIASASSDREAAEILGMNVNAVTQWRIRHFIAPKQTRENREALFASWVAGKLNGRTEYPINGFRVDVLTSDQIIECKYELTMFNYYTAIGQLMAYSAELGNTYCLAIACVEISDQVSDHMKSILTKLTIDLMQFADYSNCAAQA